MGYCYDYKILNAADYGAYTNRHRFYGQFSKGSITWPKPTHTKSTKTTMFCNQLEQHKAVKDVLDLNSHGNSIFNRTKQLSEKTLERILAGLNKFGSQDAFLCSNYTHVNGNQPRVQTIDKPCPTVPTANIHSLVKPVFISKAFSGDPKSKNISCSGPAGAVTTIDHHQVISVAKPFLVQYHGCGENVHDVANPSPTVTTINDMAFVSYKQFLWNPGWFGNSSPISVPSPTIVARQDKAPVYLCSALQAKSTLEISHEDSAALIGIKEFCLAHGISDIFLRMLNITELLKIQGFPPDYKLVGTKKDQTKFVGNSVHTIMSKVLSEANYSQSIQTNNEKDNPHCVALYSNATKHHSRSNPKVLEG
jgi:DNA (cytosine-5)-methyltransferase 1